MDVEIREHLLAALQALVRHTQGQLLDRETRQRILRLRDELLGASTAAQLSLLRAELLGPATNTAIKAIIDSAMVTIAYRMRHDLKEAIGENASFLQKYAGRLLILLGLIAALIVWLVWQNRKKYVRLVQLLTAQIHDIDHEKTYNELTLRIQKRAVESGVEPTLKQVLKQNGLEKESWKNRQLKKGVMEQQN